MIWIIGGTSEARELIERISDFNDYIVTIATDEGREFIDTENIIVGRMNYDEMILFSKENNISMIVDLSHPYAKIVSENAKRAAEELKIEYIRYMRKKSEYDLSIYLESYEEAYKFLSNIKGTIFFTTGSKNIGDFEIIRGNNRFIYRILPALESIQICKKHNIHMKDIVAELGPFSKEYNKIMFEEYGVDYVIMKDSGEKGGTPEKIQACKELGIKSIIIGREEEEGVKDLEEIRRIINAHKHVGADLCVYPKM